MWLLCGSLALWDKGSEGVKGPALTEEAVVPAEQKRKSLLRNDATQSRRRFVYSCVVDWPQRVTAMTIDRCPAVSARACCRTRPHAALTVIDSAPSRPTQSAGKPDLSTARPARGRMSVAPATLPSSAWNTNAARLTTHAVRLQSLYN